MEYYLDKSHVSPPERAAFQGVLDAGVTDVVRPHTPGPGVYTYWDYQQLAFPKKRGMRIGFVLASEALAARVDGAGGGLEGLSALDRRAHQNDASLRWRKRNWMNDTRMMTKRYSTALAIW